MKELLNKGGFDSFSMQTSVFDDGMSLNGSTVDNDGMTKYGSSFASDGMSLNGSTVASDGRTLYGSSVASNGRTKYGSTYASSYGGTSYGTDSQTNLSATTYVRFVLKGFLYIKLKFYNASSCLDKHSTKLFS